MLYYMREQGLEILSRFINLEWVQRKIPTDWETAAIIISIYKKVDKRKCTNLRGIFICLQQKSYMNPKKTKRNDRNIYE